MSESSRRFGRWLRTLRRLLPADPAEPRFYHCEELQGLSERFHELEWRVGQMENRRARGAFTSPDEGHDDSPSLAPPRKVTLH
jgi:hypothetical protein